MIVPNAVAPLWRAAPLALLLICGVASALPSNAAAQTDAGGVVAVPPAPFVPPPTSEQPRTIVFISDLHFGLGKRPDGQWSHKEDFRWPGALKGFLDEMARRGGDRVDIVIVGDFLELWQPPGGVVCDNSGDADLGCTVAQMTSIAKTVIDAHRSDIGLLREFAERGENRLYVIPGNHDAALLLPEVWALVAAPLNEPSGHVARMTNGFWKSPDGRVIAEHGHQIGNDVNRFDRWPLITQNQKGTIYLERPWGERFVQKMFNSEEEKYEIIDNISPETVGVKYRIADRGYARSAADFARFVVFDLFETSLAQKNASFGSEVGPNDANRWNLKRAREDIGYRLFLKALPEGDPLRAEIEGQDAASEELRTELAAIALDKTRLTDEEVLALCDDLALRKAEHKCAVGTAGAMLESKFIPRSHVVGAHVEDYLRDDKRLRIFVYGHTHDYEVGWPLKTRAGSRVIIHNTGALQRTIDETGFLARVKKNSLSPNEALRKIKLEDLPPCYSAVLVTYLPTGVAESKTWRWHQEEGGPGDMVEPGDDRCD
jgi:UDP-2,3-diacylglucosamine pyrophosphatase LpxH